jgi:hypothetical protein
MTIHVKLKPEVASVLAHLLTELGTCSESNEVARCLKPKQVKRMDRELAKLATHLAVAAPELPER